MRNSAKSGPRIGATVVLLVGFATVARAGTLYTQPPAGNGLAAASQTFPPTDFLVPGAGDTLAFDDFNVTSPGWHVTGVTVFGLEQADPTQNQGVFFQIQSTSLPNFDDKTDPIYSGREDANINSPTYGNLNFTGLNITLNPGTYWITAWVLRPVAGGNWLWDYAEFGAPIGSEFLIQNPGGEYPGNTLGLTDLVRGSTFFGTSPSDLAFTIEGGLVPEPSSIVLLGVGGLSVWVFAWRRGKALHVTPAIHRRVTWGNPPRG